MEGRDEENCYDNAKIREVKGRREKGVDMFATMPIVRAGGVGLMGKEVREGKSVRTCCEDAVNNAKGFG